MDLSIDRETLRGRIRASGRETDEGAAPAASAAIRQQWPVPGPAAMPGRPAARPYRDADQAMPATPRAPRARPAPDLPPGGRAAATERVAVGTDPAPEGGFVDLDDQPLPETGATAPSTPPIPRSKAAPVVPEAPAAGTAPISPGASATPEPEGSAPLLNPPLMRRIIYLACARPGETPPFSRAQANLDGEGLRYGLGRFSQASGALGALLALMRAEDELLFAEIFADTSDEMLPAPDLDALLRVTQAPVPDDSPDRSARLAEVSGRPLWDPAWIRKFKAAARPETFQAVQYRFTAERALIPMLDFARDLGLATERGLTVLTERAILMGVPAAMGFVIDAAGPINTDALRAAALAHVAQNPQNATLASFQEAQGIAERRGFFGPVTHARLVALLHASEAPPLQLPSAGLMLEQVLALAQRAALQGLLPGILTNPKLGDTPLAASDPEME